MWVDKRVWQADHDASVRNIALITELRAQNTALLTTMDWFRVRITQVEHERAALIYKYMGVKIDVPSIEEAPEPTGLTSGDILSQIPSFEDMGDEEAKRQGIGWDAQGELTYGK